MRVYSYNTRMTSKRGTNKEVRYKQQARSVTDVLTTFWRLPYTHGQMESILYIFFTLFDNYVIRRSIISSQTHLDQSKREVLHRLLSKPSHDSWMRCVAREVRTLYDVPLHGPASVGRGPETGSMEALFGTHGKSYLDLQQPSPSAMQKQVSVKQ